MKIADTERFIIFCKCRKMCGYYSLGECKYNEFEACKITICPFIRLLNIEGEE